MGGDGHRGGPGGALRGGGVPLRNQPAGPGDMCWNDFQRWHKAAFKQPGEQYSPPTVVGWRAAQKGPKYKPPVILIQEAATPSPVHLPTVTGEGPRCAGAPSYTPAFATATASTSSPTPASAREAVQRFSCCSASRRHRLERDIKRADSQRFFSGLIGRKRNVGAEPNGGALDGPRAFESPSLKFGRPKKKHKGAVARMLAASTSPQSQQPAPDRALIVPPVEDAAEAREGQLVLQQVATDVKMAVHWPAGGRS